MHSSRSVFSQPLAAALAHALHHLSPDPPPPVAATASMEELRGKLNLEFPTQGTDAKQVIEELAAAVKGGILDSAGPRFFGWVIGGSLPAALAADWLTSAWDQNAAVYAGGPAAAIVEEVVGKWLKELLPVAPEASFALVTGAQMAHVTCLAAARHFLLAGQGIDVELHGLAGTPPIRILTSTEKHGSLVRAVRLLGLGDRNLISLPVDQNGRLPAAVLESELAGVSSPKVVVLQAGDLNIGSFDDFESLIPLAHRHGAWVHIDGAFGLWTGASPLFRPLLKGAELADSWTTDGHKWLNVPYDCGYAFVAHREAHRTAMSYHTSYIAHGADARDQMDWTPEWSRRGRGFATYAALRQLGKIGVADLIERTCAHAKALVTGIGALPGAEVLWEPTTNQGLVRFLDTRTGATEADHDAFTDQTIAGILASGAALFSGTTWRGKRAMRVSVCNWQTSSEDVSAVINSVSALLKRKRK